MEIIIPAAWGILAVIVLGPLIGSWMDHVLSKPNTPEEEDRIMRHYRD